MSFVYNICMWGNYAEIILKDWFKDSLKEDILVSSIPFKNFLVSIHPNFIAFYTSQQL